MLQLSKDILLRFVRQVFAVTVLLLCNSEDTIAGDSLHVSLHYRQGSATLNTNSDDNVKALQRMRRLAERDVRVRSVEITSSASPEGNAVFNRQLSEGRSESALALLAEMFYLDSVSLNVSSIGIDWDGLIGCLRQSDIPYADEAVSIIRNTPERVISDGVVTDSRKLRLRRLDGGEAWQYMLDSIFPQLRVSQISINYSHSLPELSAVSFQDYSGSSLLVCPDDAEINNCFIHRHSKKSNRYCLALRTNLLYDVLAVPNLGLELVLGHGWSSGVSGMYAWWSNPNRGRYWRLQGAELSLKRYFSDRTMQGHHVGAFGGIFRYDFCFGSTGWLSGGSRAPFNDHPSWSVGAEYGYATKISSRLNLDFSLGVGYMSGRYMTYRIADGHSVWQSTRQRRYFGPVKAEISLVYIIGKGVGR